MEEFVQEGMMDFSGGQNASLNPDMLPENVYSSGVNVSTARGSLTPRWRWINRDITVEGSYTRKNRQEVSYKFIYNSSNFQALFDYTVGNTKHACAIVAGFIYLINIRDFTAQVLNPNDRLDPTRARINWSKAGRFFVVFDYPNRPLILEGIQVRRSVEADFEVPVSELGTHNQNRLFIVNAGNEFTGGDPTGSSAAPDAPITFLEISIPSAPYIGQIFDLTTSYQNEPITAIGFLQVVDRSTQIGPLIVATRDSVYTFRTDEPRATWEAGQFGAVLLYNAGIIGQRAHVNVNNDLFFISGDGKLRALSMSREEQNRWSNNPISREVDNYLINSMDRDINKYATINFYRNKLFATAYPYRTKALDVDGFPIFDFAFGGYVVMETDNVAGLFRESTPVWAGLWTGIRPMDSVIIDGRMFIMSKDGTTNELYEVSENATQDVIRGRKRRVKSSIITREFSFENGSVLKLLHSLDLSFSNLRGDVDITVSYAPDKADNFALWRNFKYNAPVDQCIALPMYPNGLSLHNLNHINIGGVDENICDPINNRFISMVRSLRIRLEIEAEDWELDYIRIKARYVPTDELEVFCEREPVEVPAECFSDWEFEYYG